MIGNTCISLIMIMINIGNPTAGNKEMRFELFQFKDTPDAEDEIRAEHEAKFEELQNVSNWFLNPLQRPHCQDFPLQTAGTNNLGKPASGISA